MAGAKFISMTSKQDLSVATRDMQCLHIPISINIQGMFFFQWKTCYTIGTILYLLLQCCQRDCEIYE